MTEINQSTLFCAHFAYQNVHFSLINYGNCYGTSTIVYTLLAKCTTKSSLCLCARINRLNAQRIESSDPRSSFVIAYNFLSFVFFCRSLSLACFVFPYTVFVVARIYSACVAMYACVSLHFSVWNGCIFSKGSFAHTHTLAHIPHTHTQSPQKFLNPKSMQFPRRLFRQLSRRPLCVRPPKENQFESRLEQLH